MLNGESLHVTQQCPTQARCPTSLEEPFEFHSKAELSRKCNYRKSLPPGSTLEHNQRVPYQSGIANGNGTLSIAAEISQVSMKQCSLLNSVCSSSFICKATVM